MIWAYIFITLALCIHGNGLLIANHSPEGEKPSLVVLTAMLFGDAALGV
jgi:hypothetical protein